MDAFNYSMQKSLVIVILLVLFGYLMYPLLFPDKTPLPLFTNDPENTIMEPYKLGDIYQSLIIKARSLSNNGTIEGVIFHGKRDKKEVSLTFDADMTPEMRDLLSSGQIKSYYDDSLIQVLRNLNTPATLFLTGMWIEMYPQQTSELSQDPLFELGSHSYAHSSFISNCYGLTPLSEDEKIADVGTAQMLLRRYAGIGSKLFRFPGGCYSKSDVLLIRRTGQEVIQWDVVANDGFNTNKDAVVGNVLSQVKNGSIIVMHMNGFPNDPVTSQAVPMIIKSLKEKGYSFVTVSKLLD
jgi:peptidoglycan/xylan/chitin deacetylase (PgdA/CDA1 family)